MTGNPEEGKDEVQQSGEFLVKGIRAEGRRLRALHRRDLAVYLLLSSVAIIWLALFLGRTTSGQIGSVTIPEIALAIFFLIVLPAAAIGLYRTLRERPVHPDVLGDIVVMRNWIKGREKYVKGQLLVLEALIRWSKGAVHEWKRPVGERKRGMLSMEDPWLDLPLTPESKAAMALSLYATVSSMDWQITLLDEHGVRVPEARKALSDFEVQLRRLHEEDGEELTHYVNLGLKNMFESFESALREVLPPDPEFFYDRPLEYEMLVYDAREKIEWARDAAERLGHEHDFDRYMERLRGLDDALRGSIPFTVAETMKRGDEPSSPESYPKRFWWRHEAWKCFEELRAKAKPE